MIKNVLFVGLFSIFVFVLTFIIKPPQEDHLVLRYYFIQMQRMILILPLIIFLYKKNIKLPKINEKVFIPLILLIFFILTNIISYFGYEHIPKDDDVSLLFQAKIFKQGRLYVKAPPLSDFFFISSVVFHNNKCFSMYPPGHAIMLMIGEFFSMPWLIGPILGIISIISFILLIKELYTQNEILYLIVLFVFSPAFLMTSSSHIVHNSTLLFTILAILFFVKSIRIDKSIYFLFVGIFIGVVSMSRPYTALKIFVGIIFYLFIIRRINIKKIILIIIGMMPCVLLHSLYNYTLTGKFYKFPQVLQGERLYGNLFFGGDPTFGIKGHNLIKAIINLFYNIFGFSLQLYGWPCISLVFILLAFFDKNKKSIVKFSICMICSFIIFNSLVWFHGMHLATPRYYYELLPIFVILTFEGMKRFNIKNLLFWLVFFNLVWYLPYSVYYIRKTEWGCKPKIHKIVKEKNIHNAIVFIQDAPPFVKNHRTINMFNYASGFIKNEPSFDGDVIYARDRGAENKKLMELHPERKYYIYKCDKDKKAFDLFPLDENCFVE